MKIPFIFSFLILTICACKKEESQFSDSNSVVVNSNKKSKFSVEAERDVESLDSSIKINHSDLQKIRVRIYPSFAQDHALTYNSGKREIAFFQISQTLNRTDDYYKIPEEEREYHLYKFMKKNSSKNFQAVITQEEEQLILKEWFQFKKANYQFKNVETLDGAEFFMSIYERDTIVYANTNSPSSHHEKLIKTLLYLSEKYTKDSITIRNIQSLKEYL